MKKIIVVVFLLLFSLRFINLGYSHYCPDETTVVDYLKTNQTFYSSEFLLNQRKGSMQFVVAALPFLVQKNVTSPLLFRLPFAVANCAALVFFYLFIKKETGDEKVSLLATFLLGVNGFFVAFGRIVQYQSLNMLFSFAGLYLYSIEHEKSKKYLLTLSIGTLCFALSLLSHWDIIFVLPVFVYLFIKKFKNIEIRKYLLIQPVLFVILVLPFMFPYIKNYLSNNDNQAYFSSRVGVFEPNLAKEKIIDYYNKNILYNPFLYLPVVGILFIISLFKFKKNLIYICWFVFNFLVLLLFFKHAGTHIYNLFPPLVVLGAIGLYKLLSKKLVLVIGGFVVLILVTQSYLIFVNHKVEYPWKQEKILGFKTQEYSHQELTNNLLGFPYNKGWVEINDYINLQNEINNENLTFITNDNKSMAAFYMDAEYGAAEKYYAIGIKRPYSFANDYKFPQIKNKHTIKKLEVNGNSVARIYLVEND